MHEIKLSSRSRSDIEAELDKVIPWNDGYAHGGPMIDARKTMETDV